MLRTIWRRWLALAHKIGTFQSRILLTLFYFVVLAPFGLAVRGLADPLHMKSRSTPAGWVQRATRDVDLAAAKRQS